TPKLDKLMLSTGDLFKARIGEGSTVDETVWRIGNLIHDVRKALGESEPGVPIERATWAELRHQVGRLIRKRDEKPPVLEPAPEDTARRDLYRLIGLVGADNWNNRR